MRSFLFVATSVVATIAVIQGCSSSPKPPPFGTTDAGDEYTPLPGDDGGDPFADAGTGDSVAPPQCSPDPSNFDVPGNGCDDDGDGTIDNGTTACDQGLAVTGDAMAFAKAIGLCKVSSGGSWGVVSASYGPYSGSVQPAAEQHGILTKFGNVLKSREGANLGVLSSGWAREYDNCAGGNEPFKGGCSMTSGTGAAPTGFPKASPSCPNSGISSTVNDVIDMKLQIKVPANAKGFSFDFNFFSGEWPEVVCTTYNDSFIAYLKSNAFNNGKADNISFDSKNNPVSVNNGFFDRCSPKNLACDNFPPSYQACAGGDAELKGTGFYNPDDNCFTGSGNDSGGGATGWLTTKAPVQPGETITLEFLIWDTGDHIYDSSVLLDKFTWETTDTQVGTVRPPN